jgi:hypothetical protein
MFGKFEPALLARALRKIANRLRTLKQPSRQASRRGHSCVRAPARDAAYVPPDADWFADHPERVYRLRTLLPDDPANAPEAACGCEPPRRPHAYRILVVRRPSGHFLRVRLPTCRWWPRPSDEEGLGKLHAYLVANVPGVARLQRQLEEAAR